MKDIILGYNFPEPQPTRSDSCDWNFETPIPMPGTTLLGRFLEYQTNTYRFKSEAEKWAFTKRFNTQNPDKNPLRPILAEPGIYLSNLTINQLHSLKSLIKEVAREQLEICYQDIYPTMLLINGIILGRQTAKADN